MTPYQQALQIIEDLIQACTCNNIETKQAEEFIKDARERLGVRV